jgi:hypothetical protein
LPLKKDDFPVKKQQSFHLKMIIKQPAIVKSQASLSTQ